MWAMAAAPLLAGTDVVNIANENPAIYLNKDLIAIDQDPLGVQASTISNLNGQWKLARPPAIGAALTGWTIAPSDPVTTPQLGAGQSLNAEWTVTPPNDAGPGTYHLSVEGTLGGATFSEPIAVIVPDARLETGYLSDQQWLDAQSFWGPVERDMSNGEQDPGDGRTIAIGGVQYAARETRR
jgi:alpha-galactosidase